MSNLRVVAACVVSVCICNMAIRAYAATDASGSASPVNKIVGDTGPAVLADINTQLTLAEKGDKNALAQVVAKYQTIKGDTNISDRDQFLVSSRTGALQIAQVHGITHAARLALYEKAAMDMVIQFPAQPEPYQALLALAEDQPEDAEGVRIAKALIALPKVSPGIKSAAQQRIDRSAMLGQPLRLSYYDEKGRNHLLSEYKGKTVILVVWSTTNPGSLTVLTKLAGLAGDTVVVLGVNQDPVMAQGVAAAQKNWPTLPQAYDLPMDRGSLVKQLKLTRLPAAYIVDGAGILQDLRGLENTARKIPGVASSEKGGAQ